ncbi:hypothetical protein ZIOFF_008528 [Zingiber officinale]|uniref:VQ domain-containing protein n=1 Tax=Zingiber officinale TaxID=94328 RepID=A0A8J5LQU2_ZINOF|nr:hypothetical protein ZIOFF_008528 [Zingiber officinale]
MPSSRRELQGPRPPPLTVNKASRRGKKPATGGTGSCSGRDPVVIVYVDSPKVIHTRPQDFMSLVQRLTGKSSSSSSSHVTHCGSNRSAHGKRSSSPAMIEVDGERGEGVGGDSLLLTLGSSPIFYDCDEISQGRDRARILISGRSGLVTPCATPAEPNLSMAPKIYESLKDKGMI